MLVAVLTTYRLMSITGIVGFVLFVSSFFIPGGGGIFVLVLGLGTIAVAAVWGAWWQWKGQWEHLDQ
jgi:hypothetical protein